MKDSNALNLNPASASIDGDVRFGRELMAELCGRSLPLPGTTGRILEVTIKKSRAFAVKIRRMNEWQVKG